MGKSVIFCSLVVITLKIGILGITAPSPAFLIPSVVPLLPRLLIPAKRESLGITSSTLHIRALSTIMGLETKWEFLPRKTSLLTLAMNRILELGLVRGIVVSLRF